MADVEVRRLAEACWVIRTSGLEEASRLALWLADQPEVDEAWPAFDQVAALTRSALEEVVKRYPTGRPPASHSRLHHVPVCYQLGEDLGETCARLGLDREEFVQLHTSADLTCAAIGFSPGFAYLTGLPERLGGLSRRSDPRPAVPAGSVAIAEGMCAVYPTVSPGGWNLIGQTPLVMSDASDCYFPVAVGDRVRFVPIGPDEFGKRKGERLRG